MCNPDAEKQAIFKKSTKIIYTISFDSWYTEKKLVSDGQDFQFDNESTQQVNSPKHLITANQTADRINAPNKQIT